MEGHCHIDDNTPVDSLTIYILFLECRSNAIFVLWERSMPIFVIVYSSLRVCEISFC